MGLDEQAVRVGTAGQVHDPGLVIRPSGRQDHLGQQVAIPPERR